MTNIRLYSNCKLIKGFTRDIIIDLENEVKYFVPKSLANFINYTKKNNREKWNDIYIEYFDFLIQTRLAYKVEEPFLKNKVLNHTLNSKSKVSNCSILFSHQNEIEKIKKIENKLDGFGCESLLLIFTSEICLNSIKEILSVFRDSILRNIVIITKYTDEFNEIELNKIIQINPRITELILCQSINHSISSIGYHKNVIRKDYLIKIEDVFNNKIHPLHFVINYPFYNESITCNPYYYKKIIIDNVGNVFKDLLNNKIISNIFETDIEIIFKKPEFEFIDISKKNIDICKDCEFKFICPDNRVPVKRNKDEWYHSTECNYNTYISKWNGEDGYKTLAECGIQSNANGFKLNRKKLNAINKELWGDD